MERLFPFGNVVNSHEKLIDALIAGALDYEKLLSIVQDLGYDNDTFSTGDLLRVFFNTSTHTENSNEDYLTEEEYFRIITEAMNFDRYLEKISNESEDYTHTKENISYELCISQGNIEIHNVDKHAVPYFRKDFDDLIVSDDKENPKLYILSFPLDKYEAGWNGKKIWVRQKETLKTIDFLN